MKKRVLSILCCLALTISLFGIGAAAVVSNEPVAMIGQDEFETLQAAVTAVQQGLTNGLIELKKDANEDVTVSCDVYVDLAGHNIQSVTVTNGTFYGMDSSTVIEAGGSAQASYGKIATANGAVKAVSVDYSGSDHGYLAAKEDASGVSFHAVNLTLTAMALRANRVGLYFTSTFAGDQKVADEVQRYGIALSVKGKPTTANINECVLSEFFDFQPGSNDSENTSTLLYSIMKIDNTSLVNKRNANMPIYGRAYVQLSDGTYIFGEAKSRSLKQQVETFYRTWGTRSTADKNAVSDLCETYTNIVNNWQIPEYLYPKYIDLIYDWNEAFSKLPVVNSSMTEEELRKLCIDFYRLQLTMPWTPNADFVFLNAKNLRCSLNVGTVYTGMSYVNSGKKYADGTDMPTDIDKVPSGNVYKMLKYYNPSTGVLDIKAMGDYTTIFNTLGVQCSRSVAWAWARVSNNLGSLKQLSDFTPANGAIPVGDYDVYYVDDDSNNGIDTSKVITKNGRDKMYAAYAAMKPGDALYSKTSSHIMMCSLAAESGKEYLYIFDQNQVGTKDATGPKELISNGLYLRPLGDATWEDGQKGEKVTFADLYAQNYIPLTIKEFAGQAGAETPDAWVGSTTTDIGSGATITLDNLLQKKIAGNYSLSHFRYEIKDVAGNVLLTKEPDVITHHWTMSISASSVLDEALLRPYANGSNTIHISVFLSSGEWVDAFWRTLNP